MALPLAALGIGASLFGGLLGRSERPTLSPEMLRQFFGPQQLGQDANELFSTLAQGPGFSAIMNSGAIQGAQLSNRLNRNLARAGIGGSGIGATSRALGQGFGASIQRQGQQALFHRSLSAALPLLQQRQADFTRSFLQRQGQPTHGRMIGSSLLSAGAQGLSSLFGGGGGEGGQAFGSFGEFGSPVGFDPSIFRNQ